jgi:hypothetical protein
VGRLRALQWWAPVTWLPHGTLGLLAMASGVALIGGAMSGEYGLVESWVLTLFALTTGGNAVSGYAIAGRAGRYEGLFQRAALFQVSLVYFAWRFSPRCPPEPWLVVRAADVVFAAGVVLGIVSFGYSALAALPPATANPLVLGCFALMLLAGCERAGSPGRLWLSCHSCAAGGPRYPMQLAVQGDEWWQCVQGEYPKQSVGMAGYIYVPAAWSFAAILFGATLLNRKVVGENKFGLAFGGLVLLTLLGTVRCPSPFPMRLLPRWLSPRGWAGVCRCWCRRCTSQW